MSSRMWKFISNTIGKLQSPRPSQQDENVADSSSLHQTDYPADTPTRHGNSNSNKVGEQLVDNISHSEQDDSILNTLLNKKGSNVREQLEEASKETKKNEPQEDVQEDVTASNTSDYDSGKAPKSTKKSPSDGSFAIPPPRYGRNKENGLAETAEPLAHTELPVDNTLNTRKTRGRDRPAKTVQTVVYDEAPSSISDGINSGLEEKDIAEVVEPLAHIEPTVDNSLNTRKTRTRSRPAKKAETVVHDEAPSYTTNGTSDSLQGENSPVAEPLEITEPPVDNSLNTRTTRGRGRPAKVVVHDATTSHISHEEISILEEENITEVKESSVRDENLIDIPETNHKTMARGRPAKTVVYDETLSHIPHGENSSLTEEKISEVAVSSVHDENPIAIPESNHNNNTTRRIFPKVEDPINTPEPFVDTPATDNKRRRDVLESSTGIEGLEINSPASASNKRRKLAPKPDGMDTPPVGNTQQARDERRKYMDRERQRRCRQRKKERQQGEQAAEREVVAQAKDERKKAMARERVRRHRENQRSKRDSNMEPNMGDRQQLKEDARQRDRDLIASGARNVVEKETFNTE
ncbi:hypothetical protein SBOR_8450 [Sclerotinia borealis F-4128]|uniref:Uncharacterized protein n=1 Tax=Sclerotinia borealis (strain F-4128) TaxID=1432307 RepID=W9C5Z3_SCLBF|nr:hypothetical protein SBOR_8450 [Sclerotinia borealis F-4128]